MYSRNLAVRAVAAARQTPICHRGFAFSTTKRLGLKESSTQTNAAKDSLAKQKKGSGHHWEPELATASEDAVRADRTSEKIAALQERTKRAAEETSKAGTSMRDAM